MLLPALRDAGAWTPRSEPTGTDSASFEAEPPASRSEGFRLVGSTTRVGRRGSRHDAEQTLWLLPADSLPDTLFSGAAVPVNSDTVAHVAGITGRSSPAPEWWGRRPRRSFGTGEEQPSSPATTEGESHIKAPPSTSEVARPSEVGWGRLPGARCCGRCRRCPRCHDFDECRRTESAGGQARDGRDGRGNSGPDTDILSTRAATEWADRVKTRERIGDNRPPFASDQFGSNDNRKASATQKARYDGRKAVKQAGTMADFADDMGMAYRTGKSGAVPPLSEKDLVESHRWRAAAAERRGDRRVRASPRKPDDCRGHYTVSGWEKEAMGGVCRHDTADDWQRRSPAPNE